LLLCFKFQHLSTVYPIYNYLIKIYLFYRTVGVLGAGLMGAGIAHVTVDKGLQVILKDTNKEGLAKGIAQIEKGLTGAVKRKKLTA